MLSYTKATLEAALTAWLRNSAPEFETNIDSIVKMGELRLIRALDLECQVSENDTATATDSGEVFKPDGLVTDHELWITVGSTRYPLLKRGRAWIRLMGQTSGSPLYYCELDETRWNVGPPADDLYLIEVVGKYAPESITDGNDDNTTWMSTTVPDLLFLACQIEACGFLKFYDRQLALLQQFTSDVAIYRGESPNQESTQGGDQLGDRQSANPQKMPGA